MYLNVMVVVTKRRQKSRCYMMLNRMIISVCFAAAADKNGGSRDWTFEDEREDALRRHGMTYLLSIVLSIVC